MLLLKSLSGYILQNKLKASLLTAISALGIGAGQYIVVGMVQFGADHAKPRLDQLSYATLNLFRSEEPDVVLLYSCDWTTAGNIISLHNQLNSKESSPRLEKGMEVVSVTSMGQNYTLPYSAGAIVVGAEFGSAVFFKSGFYTYVSSQKSVENIQDESFLVELKSPASVVERTTLSIDAFVVERTANRMADYGNQTDGSNFDFEGQPGYQTSLTNGALLFGWTESDILVGSSAHDAIYGWTNDDHLRGLAGNDVLNGEFGSNTLSEGAGADVFVIHSSHAMNHTIVDRIVDFSIVDGDVLSLSDVISAFNPDEALKFIKIQVSQGEMVVLVNSYGDDGDFFPVVRIDANLNFNPLDQNLVDLIAEGFFQLG